MFTFPTTLFNSGLGNWPITGTSVASPINDGYGPRDLGGNYDFHRGIDIPGTVGTNIYPILPGTVVRTVRQFTPVELATTAAINLSSAPANIDGTPASNGDRILVRLGSTVNSGSSSSDNGLYIYNGAGLPMSRSSDFSTGPFLAGSRIYVINGGTLADETYELAANVTTVGSDPVTWDNISGGLERFGNFVVVSHGPIGAVSVHQTTYLHLDTINVAVNDKVSPLSVLGGMGNSGYQINTVHLHFEYYQNINDGTISRLNTRSPLRLLFYNPATPTITGFKNVNDIVVTIVEPVSNVSPFIGSISLVRFVLSTDATADVILDYETREGMDTANDDTNPYNDILQNPSPFNSGSSQFQNEITFQNSYGSVTTATLTVTNVRGQTQSFLLF